MFFVFIVVFSYVLFIDVKKVAAGMSGEVLING
jgi:hypothetical protein